jgi:hypothetical protein
MQGSMVGALAGSAAAQTPAVPAPPVTLGIIGAGIRGIWLIGTARDAGAREPSESYSYPLDSWPRDQKEKFLSEHPPHRGDRSRPGTEVFEQTREGTEDHFRNLLHAMETREQPSENVEFGLGTSVACHMANLSYLRKKPLCWDPERLELRG